MVTRPAIRLSRDELVGRATLAAWWVAAAWSLVLTCRMLTEQPGMDAHAYWLSGREPLAYARAPGQVDAFLYSPLFADLVRPLAALPWPAFWAVWAAMEGAALLWLLKPLGIRWMLPFFLVCAPELEIGNVYILIAAATVIGRRRPTSWVFPILTKVTFGVGLAWHAAKGEWRRLLEVVVVLVGVIGVSYLLQPDAWQAWARFLTRGSSGSWGGVGLLIVRCLIATALVVVAARAEKALLMPVALVIANPIPGWMALTMLAAIPRLLNESAIDRPAAEGGPEAVEGGAG